MDVPYVRILTRARRADAQATLLPLATLFPPRVWVGRLRAGVHTCPPPPGSHCRPPFRAPARARRFPVPSSGTPAMAAHPFIDGEGFRQWRGLQTAPSSETPAIMSPGGNDGAPFRRGRDFPTLARSPDSARVGKPRPREAAGRHGRELRTRARVLDNAHVGKPRPRGFSHHRGREFPSRARNTHTGERPRSASVRCCVPDSQVQRPSERFPSPNLRIRKVIRRDSCRATSLTWANA